MDCELETLDMPELHVPFLKLGKDMRAVSKTIGRAEARWLVNEYYTHQRARVRVSNQVSAREKSEEKPHQLVEWVKETEVRFESALKSALGIFAAEYRVGHWIQSLYGFGPIISAGMISYFDIRRAPTVGHCWRFAGLDPTSVWKKGETRPWCTKLKALCLFGLGETLWRFHNKPQCFYGQLFEAKKIELTEKNEAGAFAATAAEELKNRGSSMEHTLRIGHWKQGRLAPAHIYDRARRWTVKLFISHLHHAMFQDYYQADPPAPYIFAHPELGDHRHLIEPPGWSLDLPGKPLRDLYLIL